MHDLDQRMVLMIASAVIDRYGIDAASVAFTRADMRLRSGDVEGADSWRLIEKAVGRLQRSSGSRDESLAGGQYFPF